MPDSKLNILLVDDNYEFARRMSELLSELSAVGKVKVALNYEEAVRIISEQMPDLALLDIHLPGKNGIEVLKLIKNSEKPCRVVMATNQADEYHQNLCRKLGAEYFFDKTSDLSAIPGLIHEIGNKTL